MLHYAEDEIPIRWWYMHNNNPKHTPRWVKNWLEEHNIKVMWGPTQSPHLNPIENQWIDVKKGVRAAKPCNFRQLWDVVENTWRYIPVRRCQRLGESMPRRMHTVIKNIRLTRKY
ncbi:putative phosphatidylinositol-3,4-bisphosphate 4-phosphatase [Trypoxylus dichotomus]